MSKCHDHCTLPLSLPPVVLLSCCMTVRSDGLTVRRRDVSGGRSGTGGISRDGD